MCSRKFIRFEILSTFSKGANKNEALASIGKKTKSFRGLPKVWGYPQKMRLRDDSV